MIAFNQFIKKTLIKQWYNFSSTGGLLSYRGFTIQFKLIQGGTFTFLSKKICFKCRNNFVLGGGGTRNKVYMGGLGDKKHGRNFFSQIHNTCTVTASSGTATSTSTCSENFVKNSFKFDVALKHAQDEVPAKKSTPEKQKSPHATNKHRRRKKDVPDVYRTRYCVNL